MLNFYQEGSFQDTTERDLSASQQTVSRIIHWVSRAIAAHGYMFIRYPKEPREVAKIRADFAVKHTFSNQQHQYFCVTENRALIETAAFSGRCRLHRLQPHTDYSTDRSGGKLCQSQEHPFDQCQSNRVA
jgi:hypothetical protein